MKGVLLDSDVIIEVLRQRDRGILDQWSDLAASDSLIACSPITVAEVWSGARDNEEVATAALFDVIPCLDIDSEIGRLAGKQMRKFAKSHNLDIADALIGATALVNGLVLWTRNRKHYPLVGLQFFPPSVH
jgi:predicted nucleic acid-binding protein